MKVHLECITAPTVDTTGASFILHFDSRRYVFGNLHEGFQRAALQQGTKFTRVSDIFLTGKTEWRSTGGIIGFILTLADIVQTSHDAVTDAMKKTIERKRAVAEKNGAREPDTAMLKIPEIPRLALHGGPNIAQTIATGRRFIFRQGLPIDVHEHITPSTAEALEPSWEDELVRVWAMPAIPSADVTTTSTPPKRSFDDFLESEVKQKATEDSEATGKQDEGRFEFLQSIVKDMFESDWRLDALFETRLRELKLPATVFVRDPETRAIEKYGQMVPENPADRPDIEVLVRKPWPGALIAKLPQTQPSPVSMSYIVRTHVQRGKFMPQKAKDLKIPAGAYYSRLAAGETITLEDGRSIKPEQVLGAPRPSTGFLIAELPSSMYLEGFLSRPEISDPAVIGDLKAMAWILGPGVVDDSRFQDFIRKHDFAKHIIAAPDYNANHLVFEAAGAATIRHTEIDPYRYDFPSFSDTRKPLPDKISDSMVAERGMTVNFEPKFSVDTSSVPAPLNTATVLDELSPRVREEARQAVAEVRSESFQQLLSQQQILGGESEIITIGTGSALPSKYRNVSATLLRVPGVGSYLFDCGENTLGQLSRLYKPEQLNSLLRDLRMIWISHLHADHHLGTASVIKARHAAMQSNVADSGDQIRDTAETPLNPVESLKRPGRLFVASDGAMLQWLTEYSQIEDFGLDDVALLDVTPANGPTSLRWSGQEVGFGSTDPLIVDALRSATGLADFAACWVPHCKGAQGVALTFPDGFKVSYSGDTRPARAFVDIGQNSTVLIHEATFEDDRAGDAAAKNHSTTSQAINVGRRMNAKRVILTHFSQRYTKIPVMSDIKAQEIELVEPEDVEQDAPEGMANNDSSEATVTSNEQNESKQCSDKSMSSTSRPSSSLGGLPSGMKVGVAFDGMRVKVKDIMALEKFTPALMALYEGANRSTIVTEDERTKRRENHRQQKTERKAEQKTKRLRAESLSRPSSSQSQQPLEASEQERTAHAAGGGTS